MRLRQITLAFVFCALSAGAAYAATTEERRVLDATDVLDQLLRIPEQGVPSRLLSRAHAVAVIPRVIKVGFGLGVRRGKGILVVRQDDNTWSNPAFITLTGGSFGFQAGAQSSDIILVFKTRAGVDSITQGKLTLGADASVAAGPVGRSAAAATDLTFKSEVFSYSRSRGLFAGVALDGAGVTMDRKANAAFYGSAQITPEQIFAGSGNAAPQEANAFVQVLTAKTSGLPQRPSSAVVRSTAEPQPQEQDEAEVRTYGMNNDPDDDID
jgi:lipid-binding SYLF domain-containing protein